MSRGVSPVIIATIVVLVFVSVGSLLWLWINTSYTTEAHNIVIERVNVNTTTRQLTIYVRNIGNKDVYLIAAYIADVDGHTVYVQEVNNTAIHPDHVMQITINGIERTLMPGFTYYIKLVTSDGTEIKDLFLWS